jgi:hypothetical protein
MSQRTTLTLEDDVAARLKEEAARQRKPLKDVVNETLRRGLDADVPEGLEPYKVRARPMGLRPGMEIDSISGLLDRLDGPTHT